MNNVPLSGNFFEDNYNFYTADGMAINLNTSTPCNPTCGIITVDINGIKKPNKLGRDVFFFNLDQDGSLALLYSYWENPDSCKIQSSTSLGEGEGCAARIMEEGWKMNY